MIVRLACILLLTFVSQAVSGQYFNDEALDSAKQASGPDAVFELLETNLSALEEDQ